MVAKLLQMFRLSLFLPRITKTSLKPTRVSAVMAMTPAVWRPGKRATLEDSSAMFAWPQLNLGVGCAPVV